MRITDRSKDVIKSGGEWISSIDLENLAVGHPAVAEAAVIGVYHPKWDERPLLIIQLKQDQKAKPRSILKFMDGKIAKWWMPDDVAFVDGIPHTATGKTATDGPPSHRTPGSGSSRSHSAIRRRSPRLHGPGVPASSAALVGGRLAGDSDSATPPPGPFGAERCPRGGRTEPGPGRPARPGRRRRRRRGRRGRSRRASSTRAAHPSLVGPAHTARRAGARPTRPPPPAPPTTPPTATAAASEERPPPAARAAEQAATPVPTPGRRSPSRPAPARPADRRGALTGRPPGPDRDTAPAESPGRTFPGPPTTAHPAVDGRPHPGRPHRHPDLAARPRPRTSPRRPPTRPVPGPRMPCALDVVPCRPADAGRARRAAVAGAGAHPDRRCPVRPLSGRRPRRSCGSAASPHPRTRSGAGRGCAGSGCGARGGASTVLAAVSQSLRNTLRTEMDPDLNTGNPVDVTLLGLGGPGNRGSTCSCTAWTSTRSCATPTTSSAPGTTDELAAPPSRSCSATYDGLRPTPTTSSAIPAQTLLGEAMRVFHQFPVVPQQHLDPDLAAAAAELRVMLVPSRSRRSTGSGARPTTPTGCRSSTRCWSCRSTRPARPTGRSRAEWSGSWCRRPAPVRAAPAGVGHPQSVRPGDVVRIDGAHLAGWRAASRSAAWSSRPTSRCAPT